jgi:hypothetical protein
VATLGGVHGSASHESSGICPEGLELEPFGDVVLDFDFDQGKWSLEGVVGEVGQL